MAGSPRSECIVMASLLPLLLLSTVSSGHTTYYIKPTHNTPCPADPCFTLSDYAQQLPNYLTSNTTLLLLPGDHVLSVNFTVRNVSSLEILSSADSHATRIVCQGLIGFSFRNISQMAIRGLTVNSCGNGAATDHLPTTYGVLVHSVLDTSISDCSFHHSVGTALVVSFSSLNLRGSNSFASNCRRCLDKSTIFGGGIHAWNSTLNFSGNSTFSNNNNSAEYGGGIVAVYSTLNFIGSSTFGNNLAAIYGGAVCAFFNTVVNFNGDTILRNNSAKYGGGIHAQGSALNLNGSSIFKTTQLRLRVEGFLHHTTLLQWRSQGRVVARAQVGQGCMHYRAKLFLKRIFIISVRSTLF